MTRWNIQYWSWDFKVVERRCVVFQIETAYLVDKRWDCRSCNRRQWSGIDKCNMWNIVDGIATLLQSEHIFLQQVHHILCRETGSSCDNLDDNRVHCCKCKTYYQEMALGIPIRRENMSTYTISDKSKLQLTWQRKQCLCHFPFSLPSAEETASFSTARPHPRHLGKYNLLKSGRQNSFPLRSTIPVISGLIGLLQWKHRICSGW